jgi:hypothetical protein
MPFHTFKYSAFRNRFKRQPTNNGGSSSCPTRRLITGVMTMHETTNVPISTDNQRTGAEAELVRDVLRSQHAPR